MVLNLNVSYLKPMVDIRLQPGTADPNTTFTGFDPKPTKLSQNLLGTGLGQRPRSGLLQHIWVGAAPKTEPVSFILAYYKAEASSHVKLCYKAACSVSVTPCREALPLTYLHGISTKAAFGCTVDKDYDLRYLSSEDKNKKV